MAIVEKLLELVYSNRILYDLSDVDYTNIRRKDEIWNEIGQELNESCKYLPNYLIYNIDI